MQDNCLTIALSKGTLLNPTVGLLEAAGLPSEGIVSESRNMVFDFPGDPPIKYIICRPTDVPAYVEHGAADLGIVGKDVIVEQGKDVFEMVDLEYGYCRFVVAVPAEMRGISLKDLNYKRVATKFPNVAESFFRQQGLQVEVIKLHGNIELAPLMGLVGCNCGYCVIGSDPAGKQPGGTGQYHGFHHPYDRQSGQLSNQI